MLCEILCFPSYSMSTPGLHKHDMSCSCRNKILKKKKIVSSYSFTYRQLIDEIWRRSSWLMQILSRGAPKNHSPSTSHYEMKLPQPSFNFVSLTTHYTITHCFALLSLSLSLSQTHTIQ